MRLRSRGGRPERAEQVMTPMIDVVFQLLAFFTLTLKIIAPEGDFQVKMPAIAPGPSRSDDGAPVVVRLRADAQGRLAGIGLGSESLRDFGQLRSRVRDLAADHPGPRGTALEVEFDCDYRLRYEHTVDAITAVSGYVDRDGRSIVELVEKIKFSPPRSP